MPPGFFLSLLLLAILLSCSTNLALEPTSPPSMAVRAGDSVLKFDLPEIHELQALLKGGTLPDAPKNFEPTHNESELWPGTLRLTPLYDSSRTHILGGLFRSFQPETLQVSSSSGIRYQRDVDFLFQEDWGLIANKDNRMSGKITAKSKAALQRLDLVQVSPSGKISVKKGISSWLCPELPQPDPEHRALAGIYIAPWRATRNPHFDKDPQALSGATEYAITQYEILPILPFAKREPIAMEQLSKTLAKLRAGKEVKIAFTGDSITLGAESTRWWEDKYDENSKTWKGRLVHSLKQRFPNAKVEVIEAYAGGTAISYGLKKMPEMLAQKPDLVVVAFGANDADGEIGEPARTSATEFGRAFGSIAEQTKTAGGEVLFVTSFPLNPWMRSGAAQRLENEHIPALKKAGKDHGAAVADVFTEYKSMNARGIPYWSQMHNWLNHPGDFGHQVYAETILRCFPE